VNVADGFWNGTDNTWPGPGQIDLLDKASFSDDAGHTATPTNDPSFPLLAGKTDLNRQTRAQINLVEDRCHVSRPAARVAHA